MKKILAVVFSLLLTVSAACAEDLYASLSDDAQLCYNAEIACFVDSCLTIAEYSAKESLTDDESDMLEELRLDYLLASDCPGFGYTYQDLDANGIPELIIAVSPTEDEFYGKMVLEVCTLDEEENCVPVFASAERDRYYWLGDDTFANIGSNGAADSVDTTLRYKNGQLEDLCAAADPAKYVQFELTEVYPVTD